MLRKHFRKGREFTNVLFAETGIAVVSRQHLFIKFHQRVNPEISSIRLEGKPNDS